MYFGTKPYGLEGYIEHGGDGNMFRGEDFGQPKTLEPGDVLANGLMVADHPYEAGNGGVGLKFTNDTERVIAARIPLLLNGEGYGKEPSDLEVGDIFQTGCVVLSPPKVLAPNDPNFEAHRREVAVNITSGHDGALIGMPHDLVIALHSESYPPSQNNLLGALAIAETLKMGARARKLLPNYGRLTDEPEHDRVATVMQELDTLRTQAQTERANYLKTVANMKWQCEQLKGVELRITGRLYGRGGTRVFEENPMSWVENLDIEVISARVNTYDGNGATRVTDQLPYIEFQGRTIHSDEHVSAWLDMGEFGVTAEVVNNENDPA